MVSKKTVNTLLASAVALTVAGGIGAANADTHEETEKCYGVVKAGHNDCGAADKSHACAGHAAKDADPKEWVSVPAGLCDKLAGGSTEPVDAAEGHEDNHDEGHKEHGHEH